MYFLEGRIKKITEELMLLSRKNAEQVKLLEYKKGNFIHPLDAEADGQDWETFDTKQAHWYGPDAHYWFRFRYEVPGWRQGKSLWLRVDTGTEEWPEQNPQFLLFVDGQPVQGVDANHREVRLADSGEAGRVYELELQAYTGAGNGELGLRVELLEVDAGIEKLYYDLVVPLRAFSRMEEDSLDKKRIRETLNDGVNLLDLREPWSEAFYRSVEEADAYLEHALYEKLAGWDEVIATCIGHTHIDVAWKWTVEQTREKTGRSFATVLKLMDEYPGYRFMSSQPQLYAFLKERYPELYARVKERIAQGRWEPEGGMWVEADCNLTSGESLVRQLLHGKRFFREEFGVDSRVLWLPDVFGYSGALPQIMKRSGIEYFMTTKLAWNQINQFPYDTFLWKGIDGTQILTHLVTTLNVGQSEDSYFTTYNGELHPDAILGGWKRYQNKEINNDILISFGYGDGGGGPSREMLETSVRMEKGIRGIPKVRQAFSRTYFDELKKRVEGNRRLGAWEGELYFEYHRGTYTSMARNKRSNRKCEGKLMDLELLGVLSGDYPAQALERMWKTVLRNQFHDILPGSSIHEVYEVTRQEYEEVLQETEALIGERLERLYGKEEGIRVLNTLGFVRDDVVHLGELDAQALEDMEGNVYPVQRTEAGSLVYLRGLPSKGSRRYRILKEREGRRLDKAGAEGGIQKAAGASVFHREGNHLETPFYIVEFDENGLLSSLYDKENDREVLQEGRKGNLLRMYEDKPQKYDNWDIDMYYTEKFWDAEALSHMEWTEEGPVCTVLRQERRISRSMIRQEIFFYGDSRRIDFKTWVDWKERQHLLKVHFPVDVHTDEAVFEIQFGNVARKVHQNTSWDQARFEVCGQKWMDLSEGHYGVSLLNDCKYGHSVENGCIGLTLIKSGIFPNPAADQEEHTFTYSLYPHGEGWRQAGTVREAYQLNVPAYVWGAGGASQQTDSCSCVSVCPPETSYASVDRSNVILETIKQAEDGKGVILRLYESENARTKMRVYMENLAGKQVYECSLMEERERRIPVEGDSFADVIRPYEIKTYLVVEEEEALAGQDGRGALEAAREAEPFPDSEGPEGLAGR